MDAGIYVGAFRLAEGIIVGVVLMMFVVVVWRERLKPEPGQYRELVDTVARLSGDVARLTVRQIDMEKIIAEYDRGVRRLIAQVRRLGHEPEWEPNGAVAQLRAGRTPKLRLYDLMKDHFDLDELREVVFELGLSVDDLTGATRPVLTMELIELVDRMGREPELVDILRRKRPTIRWPSDF